MIDICLNFGKRKQNTSQILSSCVDLYGSVLW